MNFDPISRLEPLQLSSCQIYCPECRADKAGRSANLQNDHWWNFLADIPREHLVAGFYLDPNVQVKAGVWTHDLDMAFGGHDAMVSESKWTDSITNSIYSQFWSEQQAPPATKFDENVTAALRANRLLLAYHVTSSKKHRHFGIQCRQCHYTLAIEWWGGNISNPKIRDTVQRLMAAFVDSHPYMLQTNAVNATSMPAKADTIDADNVGSEMPRAA